MRNIEWRNGYWYNSVYLRTHHWKKVRMACISRAGGWCEGCLWRRATVVHHLNYLRLFDERHEDVLACASSVMSGSTGPRERRNDNQRQLPLPLPHPTPQAANDNEPKLPLPERMRRLPKAANDNQLQLPLP